MLSYQFDLARFDFERIHNWLTHTYWSPGISRERVERGFRHSTVCVGAFDGESQVGVARVLSDTTRFAYLADVFVDEAYRKRGIAREMVRQLVNHQLVGDANTWCLMTLDAHGVYQSLGFEPTRHPERFMICYNKALAQPNPS